MGRLLTTAAGCVHICPGAICQALADLGTHHLALPSAHILNLIVHGQEVDSLHLVPSQAPVPDAPFPGRVYDLATWGVSQEGVKSGMVGETGKAESAGWGWGRGRGEPRAWSMDWWRTEGLGWDARGWKWGWVQNSAEGQKVMSQD